MSTPTEGNPEMSGSVNGSNIRGTVVVSFRMMQKSEKSTEEWQSETKAVSLFQSRLMSDSPKLHIHLPLFTE